MGHSIPIAERRSKIVRKTGKRPAEARPAALTILQAEQMRDCKLRLSNIEK